MIAGLGLKSKWNVDHYRKVSGLYRITNPIWEVRYNSDLIINRNGVLCELIDVEPGTPNLVTNEGLNHALDALFHGSTQKTTWYIGLFESDSTPAAGWTYDTWADSDCTEWQDYDEATRPAWVEAAASGQSMATSTRSTFTTAAAGDGDTVYGGALVSNSTKGDHTAGDTLFCSAAFTDSKTLAEDDVLKVGLTIDASDQ